MPTSIERVTSTTKTFSGLSLDVKGDCWEKGEKKAILSQAREIMGCQKCPLDDNENSLKIFAIRWNKRWNCNNVNLHCPHRQKEKAGAYCLSHEKEELI